MPLPHLKYGSFLQGYYIFCHPPFFGYFYMLFIEFTAVKILVTIHGYLLSTLIC